MSTRYKVKKKWWSPILSMCQSLIFACDPVNHTFNFLKGVEIDNYRTETYPLNDLLWLPNLVMQPIEQKCESEYTRYHSGSMHHIPFRRPTWQGPWCSWKSCEKRQLAPEVRSILPIEDCKRVTSSRDTTIAHYRQQTSISSNSTILEVAFWSG